MTRSLVFSRHFDERERNCAWKDIYRAYKRLLLFNRSEPLERKAFSRQHANNTKQKRHRMKGNLLARRRRRDNHQVVVSLNTFSLTGRLNAVTWRTRAFFSLFSGRLSPTKMILQLNFLRSLACFRSLKQIANGNQRTVSQSRSHSAQDTRRASADPH